MAADLTTRKTTRWTTPKAAPAVLWATIAAVLAIRLLHMRDGASPDEGGFLVVASQWHSGGSSLYGDYWVDRPPLLITVFKLIDLLGGVVALRIVGALICALTIWMLHSTARRVFGERPAAWTAITAGALLISPLYGAIDVNGELIALPFVVLGIRLAVEAVLAEDGLVARLAALGAGMAAVAAVLVKQNMADVVVFAAIAWVVGWRVRRISGSRLLALVGFAALGAVLAYALVMLWALAHGTSPYAAYEATYPFRVKAGELIADDLRTSSSERLRNLVHAFLGSMVPIVLAATAVFGLRRSREPWMLFALAGLLAWGAFSVLAGGSYWLHYLIETLPAVALSAGVLAAAAPRIVRPVVGLVALSGLIAGTTVIFSPTPTPGTEIGRALDAVARPGDTVISAFGDADILRVTGMRSPYPYLWSLPSRVRDPEMTLLRGVLTGPDAPAWIVVRGPGTETRLKRRGAMAEITDRYRKVGTVCERNIYLRDDLERSAPVTPAGADCGPR
ncbi:hypothetical protein EFK50_07250 [Nocardioides marmoriginsengisoli]|uniref:Glycosyltransferase RgtA/B/C/D-like domain-containing protein n=1 Tax=Nocardioides marmoriginsengisoli TaxID=661483 RepID=A0A3N0CLH4_9ACTN|nr:glycosyltransferase family 39 protein [Nocardioides marmoriginsengisoli]RNL64315.1 hypothetical protein EFK50_07250 [Nocardioides marmoriginsengisoli]